MATVHHVKNKDLLAELIHCKDVSVLCTPELLEMFSLISEKYSYKVSVNSEDDRKDVIQSGIIDAWQYSFNFDPSKSTNAFAYITQIIKNGQYKAYRKLYPERGKNWLRISITNNTYSL